MSLAQGGSTSPTSQRRLETAARQAKALALRAAGCDFATIARQLGYGGKGGAYDAVMAGLKATLQEPAAELRRLEEARLDRLLVAVWPAATSGDCRAVQCALAILDRRARLLGLDAPQLVDIRGQIIGLAAALGLDPAEALAEAERHLAGGTARAKARPNTMNYSPGGHSR